MSPASDGLVLWRESSSLEVINHRIPLIEPVGANSEHDGGCPTSSHPTWVPSPPALYRAGPVTENLPASRLLGVSPTTPLGVPLPSQVTGPVDPPQLDLMLPGTETALSTGGDPRYSWGGHRGNYRLLQTGQD